MTPVGLARLKVDEGCTLTAIPDVDSPLAQACRDHDILLIHFRRIANWQSIDATPWTIGYGCTGAGIGPNTVWTQAQADQQLQTRVQQVEAALQHAEPWIAKLGPVRQDVLVNIAFNIGISGLLKWKVTLAAVERGDFASAKADIAGNQVWERQVGAREVRCADAMGSNMW